MPILAYVFGALIVFGLNRLVRSSDEAKKEFQKFREDVSVQVGLLSNEMRQLNEKLIIILAESSYHKKEMERFDLRITQLENHKGEK